MTVDALEYLRAQDPVPHGSSAPPMEWVLARIERSEDRSGPRRGRRVGLSLVPTIAVAATLAVVAAVVVIAVTHRSHAPAHLPPATRAAPAVSSPPSPASLTPRGGMRDSVLIQGAASASRDRVMIYFGSGRGVTTHDWRADTTDGASWHVARDPTSLTMFAFAGRDGWAEGVDSNRAIRFFASHDGGRTWHMATSDAPAPGGVGGVSVADGEVWSLGEGCCSDTVLRARASGDHLAATGAQPPLGDSTNVSVIAAGRDSAYVLTSGTGAVPESRLFGTRDGGRTWQPLTAPCPRGGFGRLYPGGGAALWATCVGTRGTDVLRRSTDGGVDWTTPSARLGAITQLQPASRDVAWAVAAGGRVVRSSDGGRTWPQVWYGGKPEPTVLAGSVPPGLNRAWGAMLTVQSPATATVIVPVTRGSGHAARTNFVTYRTTDAGRTWRPSVVRLPAG